MWSPQGAPSARPAVKGRYRVEGLPAVRGTLFVDDVKLASEATAKGLARKFASAFQSCEQIAKCPRIRERKRAPERPAKMINRLSFLGRRRPPRAISRSRLLHWSLAPPAKFSNMAAPMRFRALLNRERSFALEQQRSDGTFGRGFAALAFVHRDLARKRGPAPRESASAGQGDKRPYATLGEDCRNRRNAPGEERYPSPPPSSRRGTFMSRADRRSARDTRQGGGGSRLSAG